MKPSLLEIRRVQAQETTAARIDALDAKLDRILDLLTLLLENQAQKSAPLTKEPRPPKPGTADSN